MRRGLPILASLMALATVSPVLAAGLLGLEKPRTQWVERSHASEDWPFIERRGLIMCIRVLKIRHVFFVPETKADDTRTDGVTVNHGGGSFAHLSTLLPDIVSEAKSFGKIFIPFDSFENHIRRIAPFVALGKSLCDQPEGVTIGPGDL